MLELIISIVFTLIILVYQKWFLVWIPFLPLTGRWLYNLSVLPREYSFICSYVEVLLLYSIVIRYTGNIMDRMSIWLFSMIFLSITGLIQAGNIFYFSLYFFLCLLGGTWVYLFSLKKMKYILSSHLIDITVLTWIVLGMAAKFSIGLRVGEAMLIQRGGGTLGSNYVGGILFLLLPLVKNRWISYAAIAFLCIQFSRGIYAALILYIIAWMILVNTKQSLKIMLGVSLLGIVVLNQIMTIEVMAGKGLMSMADFFISRFTLGDAATFSKGLFERLILDDRISLWGQTLKLAKLGTYMGTGLGSSWWVLENLNYYYPASNLHNMYLTALVEGGILFTLSFLGFLSYLLFRSYSINKPVFIGLLTWVFYGLYSGEVYEAARVPTCGSYYYLMFITAYINYQYKEKKVTNKKGFKGFVFKGQGRRRKLTP